MKILYPIILAILFAAAVLSQDTTNPTTDDDDATSTVSPTEPSVTTSAETTPTEQTTTIAPPETTKTSAATTTTSTTTTTTTTTTTDAPTTTTSTTGAPTTKAPPKPTPPTPEECSWNVTQNNVTCILVEMKAIFVLQIEDEVQYIALSHNASTDRSTCSLSNNTQRLVLSEPSYTLTMIFAKEGNKVYVNETSFEYTIPQGQGTGYNDSKLFAVKTGNSYMCKTQFNLQLGNVTMNLYDLHIQAFGEQSNTNFGSAEECEADDKVSDAVPIAVGCALAALIIIVLIAYLVGRRQSRQRGYQSV